MVMIDLRAIIFLIASIVLGVLVNWLYDLLKGYLPQKRAFKIFCIILVASLPLLLLTVTLPPEPEPIAGGGDIPATVALATVAINGDNPDVVVEVEGDVENSPFIINPSGEVTIVQGQTLPTPIIAQTLSVSGFVNSQICVAMGQVVMVEASGGIVVGPWVGSVGPAGTDSGVGGLSLDGYDIVPEFPHGSLLCRLDDGDGDWQVCGAERSFRVDSGGCLVFEINDNEQENNSGSFEVEVTVFEAIE